MGPSGGSRSTWVHFEKIHSILGTFPCNDFSLITESLDLSFMKEHFNPDNGKLK